MACLKRSRRRDLILDKFWSTLKLKRRLPRWLATKKLARPCSSRPMLRQLPTRIEMTMIQMLRVKFQLAAQHETSNLTSILSKNYLWKNLSKKSKRNVALKLPKHANFLIKIRTYATKMSLNEQKISSSSLRLMASKLTTLITSSVRCPPTLSCKTWNFEST